MNVANEGPRVNHPHNRNPSGTRDDFSTNIQLQVTQIEYPLLEPHSKGVHNTCIIDNEVEAIFPFAVKKSQKQIESALLDTLYTFATTTISKDNNAEK